MQKFADRSVQGLAPAQSKVLTPEQTAVLAGVVSLASFRANERLAREGATDNHLYVVVDGSLGVVKQLGRY